MIWFALGTLCALGAAITGNVLLVIAGLVCAYLVVLDLVIEVD